MSNNFSDFLSAFGKGGDLTDALPGGSQKSSQTTQKSGKVLEYPTAVFTPEDVSALERPQCEAVATLAADAVRVGPQGQGMLIAANAEFICYMVKNSIRVIHRLGGGRALLKIESSTAKPEDMSIYAQHEPGSALLASVVDSGDLFIWRVFDGGVEGGSMNTVGSMQFLHVPSLNIQRVKWGKGGDAYPVIVVVSGGNTVVVCSPHILHKNAAAASPPKVGEDGFLQAAVGSPFNLGTVCVGHTGQVTNMEISESGGLLATVGLDCSVRLWSIAFSLAPPSEMYGEWPREAQQLRCMYPSPITSPAMPAFHAMFAGTGSAPMLVTASTSSSGGVDIQLWRMEGSKLLMQQTVSIGLSKEGEAARSKNTSGKDFNFAVALNPSKTFLFAAEPYAGVLHVIHLKKSGSEPPRFDYVHPYALTFPIVSFVALDVAAPENDRAGYNDSDGGLGVQGDIQLAVAQTKPIQIYNLFSAEVYPADVKVAAPAVAVEEPRYENVAQDTPVVNNDSGIVTSVESTDRGEVEQSAEELGEEGEIVEENNELEEEETDERVREVSLAYEKLVAGDTAGATAWSDDSNTVVESPPRIQQQQQTQPTALLRPSSLQQTGAFTFPPPATQQQPSAVESTASPPTATHRSFPSPEPPSSAAGAAFSAPSSGDVSGGASASVVNTNTQPAPTTPGTAKSNANSMETLLASILRIGSNNNMTGSSNTSREPSGGAGGDGADDSAGAAVTEPQSTHANATQHTQQHAQHQNLPVSMPQSQGPRQVTLPPGVTSSHINMLSLQSILTGGGGVVTSGPTSGADAGLQNPASNINAHHAHVSISTPPGAPGTPSSRAGGVGIPVSSGDSALAAMTSLASAPPVSLLSRPGSNTSNRSTGAGPPPAPPAVVPSPRAVPPANTGNPWAVSSTSSVFGQPGSLQPSPQRQVGGTPPVGSRTHTPTHMHQQQQLQQGSMGAQSTGAGMIASGGGRMVQPPPPPQGVPPGMSSPFGSNAWPTPAMAHNATISNANISNISNTNSVISTSSRGKDREKERDVYVQPPPFDTAALVAAIRVEVQDVVKKEVQQTVMPMMAKVMAHTLDKMVRPRLDAIGPTAAAAVSSVATECAESAATRAAQAVQAPVAEAFRRCFAEQLVPSLELAVQRAFGQMNATLATGLAASPLVGAGAEEACADLSSIRSTMSELTAAMGKLSQQMESLQSNVNESRETSVSACAHAAKEATTAALAQFQAQIQAQQQQQQQAAAVRAAQDVNGAQIQARPPPPPTPVNREAELHALMMQSRFEEAITLALSASDLPLVLWTCSRLDPAMIPSQLSQPVLLCLLQQLSVELGKETLLKLPWLQAVAVALQPRDPRIIQHAAGILQGLKPALAQVAPMIATMGGQHVLILKTLNVLIDGHLQSLLQR